MWPFCLVRYHPNEGAKTELLAGGWQYLATHPRDPRLYHSKKRALKGCLDLFQFSSVHLFWSLCKYTLICFVSVFFSHFIIHFSVAARVYLSSFNGSWRPASIESIVFVCCLCVSKGTLNRFPTNHKCAGLLGLPKWFPKFEGHHWMLAKPCSWCCVFLLHQAMSIYDIIHCQPFTCRPF